MKEIAEGRKPPFTKDDMLPIAAFWKQPTIILTYYNSPWQTLNEMIKDMKSKPDYYAYCSGGVYGMSHVPVEIFARAVGVKCRHVPMKGGGPCSSSLVGEHVHFATLYPGPNLSLVEGKKLRALAVQSSKRLEAYPDVPTCKELGIDAEFYGWVGLFFQKNVPSPIVEKMREVAAKVAKDESFISIVKKAGDQVTYMDAKEMLAYMNYEEKVVGGVLKQLIKEASSK